MADQPTTATPEVDPKTLEMVRRTYSPLTDSMAAGFTFGLTELVKSGGSYVGDRVVGAIKTVFKGGTLSDNIAEARARTAEIRKAEEIIRNESPIASGVGSALGFVGGLANGSTEVRALVTGGKLVAKKVVGEATAEAGNAGAKMMDSADQSWRMVQANAGNAAGTAAKAAKVDTSGLTWSQWWRFGKTIRTDAAAGRADAATALRDRLLQERITADAAKAASKLNIAATKAGTEAAREATRLNIAATEARANALSRVAGARAKAARAAAAPAVASGGGWGRKLLGGGLIATALSGIAAGWEFLHGGPQKFLAHYTTDGENATWADLNKAFPTLGPVAQSFFGEVAKDKDGNPLKDKNGKPIYNYSARVFPEGMVAPTQSERTNITEQAGEVIRPIGVNKPPAAGPVVAPAEPPAPSLPPVPKTGSTTFDQQMEELEKALEKPAKAAKKERHSSIAGLKTLASAEPASTERVKGAKADIAGYIPTLSGMG